MLSILVHVLKLQLLFLLYADLLYIMKLMQRLCVFSLFRFDLHFVFLAQW